MGFNIRATLWSVIFKYQIKDVISFRIKYIVGCWMVGHIKIITITNGKNVLRVLFTFIQTLLIPTWKLSFGTQIIEPNLTFMYIVSDRQVQHNFIANLSKMPHVSFPSIGTLQNPMCHHQKPTRAYHPRYVSISSYTNKHVTLISMSVNLLIIELLEPSTCGKSKKYNWWTCNLFSSSWGTQPFNWFSRQIYNLKACQFRLWSIKTK